MESDTTQTTKIVRGLKVQGENDDFYLTKEGKFWALLPKQSLDSGPIAVKPRLNVEKASFNNGMLMLDKKPYSVKLKDDGKLRYEEVVDENYDYFLTKEKQKFTLLNKVTKKELSLHKVINASLEGAFLEADGKVFSIGNTPDGSLKLKSQDSDDEDCENDDNSTSNKTETEIGTESKMDDKKGHKDRENEAADTETGIQG